MVFKSHPFSPQVFSEARRRPIKKTVRRSFLIVCQQEVADDREVRGASLPTRNGDLSTGTDIYGASN
ncbi:hypothetical protein CEXT_697681 [Caerostris extrusa]|uniref:Uncharacterized protein n=1 Tax=Caerostris extrusa TaxID=172846 RepID=A0AAV4TD00_CAEEX|nr:hypothetical protein CEXT_697681 [Caerostris extrusa]